MSSLSFMKQSPMLLASFQALVSATLIIALISATFVVFEPTIGQAQESVDITITQTITGETSFTINPGNVNMDSDIASITGGTTNGTSTFEVQTNNSSGYNVTIAFDQDAAMQRNGGGGDIPDYTVAATETDFTYQTSGTGGRFGYSVITPTVGDLDPTFQHDGSNDCGSDGTGGQATYGACWAEPTTSAVTILNTSSATTGDGASSSVLFRVHVPPNPSPAIPAGTYTATATLTVANNP